MFCLHGKLLVSSSPHPAAALAAARFQVGLLPLAAAISRRQAGGRGRRPSSARLVDIGDLPMDLVDIELNASAVEVCWRGGQSVLAGLLSVAQRPAVVGGGRGAVSGRLGCGGHSETGSAETFFTASAWRRLMNWVK